MTRLKNAAQPTEEDNLRSLQLPSQLKVPRHRSSWLFRIKLLSDMVFRSRGGVIALLIALGALLSGRGWQFTNSVPPTTGESLPEVAQTAASGAQSVTLHTAKLESVSNSLTLTGTVVPQNLVNIAPSLNGLPIVEMRADLGDRVSTGQVLAVLDSSVLQAQLRQAEANLIQAQTHVQQQNAVLAEAQVLQQAALVDVDRYGSLYQAGAVSQEQLGSRQVQALTASQQIEVVGANLESARADIDGKAAEIERIETLIAQAVITAPVAGTITERFATLGDTASASTPLYSLIENHQLALQLHPEQAQLSNIRLGMPVTVSTADGETSLSLTGRVDEIEPMLDAQSRQAAVKVLLPESADWLRAGMFLQATVLTSRRRNIVVPAEAIVTQPDGQSIVFTLDEMAEDGTGTVTANRVEVGKRETHGLEQSGAGGYVEILSGLSVGDQVVMGGASYLQTDDVVIVVTENSTDRNLSDRNPPKLVENLSAL